MEPRGRIRTLIDGAINTLILLNLCWGERSLGDRLMEKVRPAAGEEETIPHENYLLLGAGLTALTESGILVASVTSDHPGTYLAINAAVKTVPRVIDLGLRKLRDRYDFSFLSSAQS